MFATKMKRGKRMPLTFVASWNVTEVDRKFPAKLAARSNEMLRSLRVRNDRKMLEIEQRESFTDSQSFLKIVLSPLEFPGSQLEKSQEDHLKRLIRDHYPRGYSDLSHKL